VFNMNIDGVKAPVQAKLKVDWERAYENQKIQVGKSFTAIDLDIVCFVVETSTAGAGATYGYRFDNGKKKVCYASDVKAIPPPTRSAAPARAASPTRRACRSPWSWAPPSAPSRKRGRGVRSATWASSWASTPSARGAMLGGSGRWTTEPLVAPRAPAASRA